MKFNKIFMAAGIMVGLLASSCSSDDDYTPGAEPGADCPTLSFDAKNNVAQELDPETATQYTINVNREKADVAGTYTIKVLRNDDDVFTVPETVSFAAGEDKAEITVNFDRAEVGTPYTLEIGLEEGDYNPYKTVKTFAYNVTRVKWNNIGKGQWIDGFLLEGFWDEVTIYQRDDNKKMYRVENPYTNALIQSAGLQPGNYQKVFTFTVKGKNVTWDKFFSLNFILPGQAEVLGAFPSFIGEKESEFDELSKVVEKDGKIAYFRLCPYWLMRNGLGWGASEDRPCYVAMPGYDLVSELYPEE